MTFTPTAEQSEAVRLFLTGVDLVIEAGAGAAKTSTLALCAEAAPHKTGQFVAFNKAIVSDASARFPGTVTCSTAHSLAFRATIAQNAGLAKRFRAATRVRNWDLVRALRVEHFTMNYGTQVKKIAADRMVGLMLRGLTNFCQSGDPQPLREHLPYVDGIDLPDETTGARTYAHNDALRSYLHPIMVRAWNDLSSPNGQLPWGKSQAFAYYLKIWERSNPVIMADYLLIDEAQDLSPVMLSIVEQQTCQKVYVGDSAQAIYGFTGAVDALARARELGGCNVTQLSKSFRFGQAVADVANGLLGRMHSTMTLTGSEQVASVVAPVVDPDVILTRTNAEAVRQVLAYLDQNKRPALVGGSAEVVSFAEAALALTPHCAACGGQDGSPVCGTSHRIETGTTNHPELACFNSWAQVQDYVQNDEMGDELRLLVKLIDEFGAERIIAALGRATAERDADVVISTAHKSKGREWATVQLAGDFFTPKDSPDLGIDELRLLYVACTRAKRELDLTLCPQALGIVPKKGAQLPAPPADVDPDEGLSALEITAKLWS